MNYSGDVWEFKQLISNLIYFTESDLITPYIVHDFTNGMFNKVNKTRIIPTYQKL